MTRCAGVLLFAALVAGCAFGGKTSNRVQRVEGIGCDALLVVYETDRREMEASKPVKVPN